MKAVILALVLGCVLNTTVEGGTWSMGTIVAVAIMGVWIKTSMDKHFEELKARMERDGGSRDGKEVDR